MGEKNRKIHIDLLRVLAAFLVLYNHAAGYQYYLNHNNDAVKIITCIVLAVLTKINVPMFFLLSGALLLQKEESYKTLFSKRILRFVLVLIGASALTYGSTHILYQHELSLSWFFRALLSGQISIPYWFLYAYLGFSAVTSFPEKTGKTTEPAGYCDADLAACDFFVCDETAALYCRLSGL